MIFLARRVKTSRLLVEKNRPISYYGCMSNQARDDQYLFEQVLPLFNAMGDQTRQQIILLLAHHERLSVGELTQRTHLSRPAISHHIKILKEAGLVEEERAGTKRYYHPTFQRYVQPMRRIIELVEEHETEEGANGE